MRRRLVALAFVVLPLPFAVFHGCGGGEPDIENLCGWLKDPENCFRAFYDDVGSRCGSPGAGTAPIGGFAGRDALDVCVLQQGGQVLFDPPLDLAAFPLKAASFKIVDALGKDCGAGAVTAAPYAFSLTVNAYPPDAGGGTTTSGAGGGGGGGTGGAGETVAGGTFSVVNGEAGRATFDTTCPPAETHHFDRFSVSECPELEPLLPRAEIESSAGAIDVPGFVKVRIFFPVPVDGDVRNVRTDVVEYFNCSIPGAPPLCQDGAQDGDETDVDCGGSCPSDCGDGQGCIDSDDCLAPLTCGLDNGIKKCLEGAATGSTSAATTGAGGGSAATTTGAGGAGGAGGASGGGGTGG